MVETCRTFEALIPRSAKSDLARTKHEPIYCCRMQSIMWKQGPSSRVFDMLVDTLVDISEGSLGSREGFGSILEPRK